MLKVTGQKQVLKVLQIMSRHGSHDIKRLTLISQSISLSLNYSQIHSILPSGIIVTAIKILQLYRNQTKMPLRIAKKLQLDPS